MRIAKALQLMRVTAGLGLREQARVIGISAATLSRLENGYECDVRVLVKLLAWMTGSEEKAA